MHCVSREDSSWNNSMSSSFFCRPRCSVAWNWPLPHSPVLCNFPDSTTLWLSACLYPLVLSTVPITEYRSRIQNNLISQSKHSVNQLPPHPPVSCYFPHSNNLLFSACCLQDGGTFEESELMLSWRQLTNNSLSSVSSALLDNFITMGHAGPALQVWYDGEGVNGYCQNTATV